MTRFTTVGLAALLLGLAVPASAQNAQEEAALRQYCSGDYLRLCGQHDPNSPAVEACFKENMAKLTPPCRNAIAAFNKNNPKGRQR